MFSWSMSGRTMTATRTGCTSCDMESRFADVDRHDEVRERLERLTERMGQLVGACARRRRSTRGAGSASDGGTPWMPATADARLSGWDAPVDGYVH